MTSAASDTAAIWIILILMRSLILMLVNLLSAEIADIGRWTNCIRLFLSCSFIFRLSACMSTNMCVCLHPCLYVDICPCLSVCMCLCLSACMSVCLIVYCVPACLRMCMYVS